VVRPAGPTEVLEILLNSTEVQTQRDVEMKSPPRLLGFRFDDDACNDMFSPIERYHAKRVRRINTERYLQALKN
jgi:hypothetical protein